MSRAKSKWRPGDPVGMGEIYLPKKSDRAAYLRACSAQIIDSAARHAINLPSRNDRREYIESHPQPEALKKRVKDLWTQRPQPQT